MNSDGDRDGKGGSFKEIFPNPHRLRSSLSVLPQWLVKVAVTALIRVLYVDMSAYFSEF